MSSTDAKKANGQIKIKVIILSKPRMGENKFDEESVIYGSFGGIKKWTNTILGKRTGYGVDGYETEFCKKTKVKGTHK